VESGSLKARVWLKSIWGLAFIRVFGQVKYVFERLIQRLNMPNMFASRFMATAKRAKTLNDARNCLTLNVRVKIHVMQMLTLFKWVVFRNVSTTLITSQALKHSTHQLFQRSFRNALNHLEGNWISLYILYWLASIDQQLPFESQSMPLYPLVGVAINCHLTVLGSVWHPPSPQMFSFNM